MNFHWPFRKRVAVPPADEKQREVLAAEPGEDAGATDAWPRRPVHKAGEGLMAGFDAAWVEAHRAKMAALKGEPIKPPPLLVEFSIPHALRLPNRTSGKHWSAGYKYRKELLPLVYVAVLAYLGHQPIQRARVTVKRYSVAVADQDNVTASVKPLIDLLLVRSKTHPSSLGILQDDSPDHIQLIVTGATCATRAEQRTICLIERLDGGCDG